MPTVFQNILERWKNSINPGSDLVAIKLQGYI